MRHSGLPLAIAGSHTSTHTLPEHRRAQNADHLAHNTPFSAFFTKVVCDLGATPPQVAASPSPIRGIARHEPPTRRRHAARRCRVVQNPHDRRCGGHRRIRRVAGLAAVPVGGGWAWPGFKATRRAKLAARTARGRAAAHGRTKQPGRNNSARGAAPVTGRCTRYGAVHPIRRGALPTDRVQHTQSQEQTRNLRDAGLAAVPVGGSGAWPGFEATRRAKLAARTARWRAAAHGRTKQPGPQPQLSRSSADTPRRAVAAIRDGNASGGQPVA